MRRLSWTAQVFILSGALVALMLVYPLTTSVGQNIAENDISGWVGSYEVPDHTFHFHFLYSGGAPSDTHIGSLPLSDFTDRSGPVWKTKEGLLAVLEAMHASHPHQLERELGTLGNVPGFLSPFSGNPVAYSTKFLKALAALRVNPDRFGGPDIPPGSVPYAKLTGGLLQIDTLANGNTFKQCQPGEMPPELSALIRHS